MGLQDLNNYYLSFLEPFKEGRVEAEFHNHSLSSAIYKISLPMEYEPGYDFNILHLTQDAAKRLYIRSAIIIFGLFILTLLYQRIRQRPISFIEVSIVFLTTHLLSGITWEYHLVSLLFVYMSFLKIGRKVDDKIHIIVQYSLLGIIILNAIIGTDTVGRNLYHYFGGYGILTWMMVLLFIYFLVENVIWTGGEKQSH